MGEIQPWQSDGLGTNKKDLERVVNTFKLDGVCGIKSEQALRKYITKLGDNCLREMYQIDEETTVQILVDCFGAVKAFHKFALIAEYIGVNRKELHEAGWISPEAYEEVIAKYEERCKKLEEQKDKVLSDYQRAAWVAEDAEKRIAELEDTLKHYKADLYDFYAQAGKLPNYDHERRQ